LSVSIETRKWGEMVQKGRKQEESLVLLCFSTLIEILRLAEVVHSILRIDVKLFFLQKNFSEFYFCLFKFKLMFLRRGFL
jgi:hypothetical protein